MSYRYPTMKTASPKLSPIDTKVMKAMRDGPIWIRSLGAFKPVADRLCDAGLVERVAAPGLRARNQMQLTAAGKSRLAVEGHR